jgi:hypothetical protein
MWVGEDRVANCRQPASPGAAGANRPIGATAAAAAADGPRHPGDTSGDADCAADGRRHDPRPNATTEMPFARF